MNTYVFDSSTKKKLVISFLIGIILLVFGAFTFSNSSSSGHESTSHTEVKKTEHVEKIAHENSEVAEQGHHQPEVTVGKTIMINTYNVLYFAFYIALAAIFFLAATNIAWGGWQIQIQKIPLAMATTIVLSLVGLMIMFAFYNHDIFHWTHEYLYNKSDARYDEILDSKHDFLNLKTFWIFSIIIATICVGMVIKWWNTLNSIDTKPSRALFSSSRIIAAVSIVLISFVINTFATWFWSMSIQPHWYSTMFTWNTMAGAAVTCLSILIIFIYFLKSKGYLPKVNDNHIHDVSKLMFAVSVFWCYTWFAQYMLIWYANLPEETEYFRLRRNMDNYGILFHGTLVFNFVLPFFMLMKRKSKRSMNTNIVTAVIIILGQYGAFFIMNCPPIIPKGGFGFISIGLLLMFGSVFVFFTLLMLSKVKDLASTTHPYVNESYHHHI